MKLEVVEYPGFAKFKENLPLYTEKFLKGEVTAFRGAYLSAHQQVLIMQLLGDELNWWPNSDMSGPRGVQDPFYYETHHQSMDETRRSNKDALMLGWHLEHVGYEDEVYLGALWSMNLFECDPDAGNTWFVDVAKVYEKFSEDDKRFLSGAVVELLEHDGTKPKATKGEADNYEFVQKHWILGIPVPRPVLNGSHVTNLVSINGNVPSDEEREKFNLLFENLVREVTENEEHRFVHSWQEGDLLLLDVFRVAHAITGGFSENQRTLKGIFGIQTTKELTTDHSK